MKDRIFKFRVWDTKHKKFVEYGIPPKEYMLDRETAWDHHDWEEDPRVNLDYIFGKTFNGRLIFQQYTGVQDMDGKEVYEGDILRYVNNNLLYQVVWNDIHVCYEFNTITSQMGMYSMTVGDVRTKLKVDGHKFEEKYSYNNII